MARADSGSAFDQNAPSIEAISEFKVTTSSFSAGYGRTSGGVQSFSTKSGTNAFHGTAFDLLRNDKLDANSWTNDFNKAPKPRDHQNDFGGSLGGPVWIPKLYKGRDKTFFFFSWEQYRNNQGFSSVTTLPTDAERTGDFSALLGAPTGATNPCDGSPVLTGQIFDPSTTQTVGGVQCRTAFPGNKITTPLSAVAQKVLTFLNVHPNRPGTLNGLANNFLFSGSKPIRDTTMTFRIDQNWGTSNKFYFSYSSRDQEVLNGTPSIPAPLDPNFLNSNFTHYTRFGWDRTISSTMINHFNIGLNRLNDFSKGESVTGVDWDAVLGISGASGPVFPQFSFSGSPLGIGYQGLSAANDDGFSSRELAALIARDPSLVGNLLKIANSSYYRVSAEPVESVDRAVVMLGTDGIRSLATAALMQPIFRIGGADFPRFPEIAWEHTFRSANAAVPYNFLTEKSDPHAAEFLSLVMGLAEIVVFRVTMDQYAKNPRLRPDASVVSSLLDIHSANVARLIGASWELSEATLAGLDGQAVATTAYPTPLGRSLYFGRVVGALAVLRINHVVADKIGKASIPVTEIPDAQIDRMWTRLTAKAE